jgi:hypothetical protein
MNNLKAVNGPLQQRTNVLDLDFARSMILVESKWSNPSIKNTLYFYDSLNQKFILA